jgi:hypothetical protein
VTTTQIQAEPETFGSLVDYFGPDVAVEIRQVFSLVHGWVDIHPRPITLATVQRIDREGTNLVGVAPGDNPTRIVDFRVAQLLAR